MEGEAKPEYRLIESERDGILGKWVHLGIGIQWIRRGSSSGWRGGSLNYQ